MPGYNRGNESKSGNFQRDILVNVFRIILQTHYIQSTFIQKNNSGISRRRGNTLSQFVVHNITLPCRGTDWNYFAPGYMVQIRLSPLHMPSGIQDYPGTKQENDNISWVFLQNNIIWGTIGGPARISGIIRQQKRDLRKSTPQSFISSFLLLQQKIHLEVATMHLFHIYKPITSMSTHTKIGWLLLF